MTLRDKILGADDLPAETVDVPEWGVSLRVRALTAAERIAYEAGVARDGKPDLAAMKAGLVVAAAIDAQGAPVFGHNDLPALLGKSAVAIERLFVVAARLSALFAKDVEVLAKN